jgi:transposase
MGAAYSQDLRDRILAAYDRGMTTKPIAALFHVSSAWARRVKQRCRVSGHKTARPMGGVRVVKVDLEKLRELVNQQPDATTKELHQRLKSPCSCSAVGMALVRLGLTFKKRRFMPPSRTGPMSLPAARRGNKNSTARRPSV